MGNQPRGPTILQTSFMLRAVLRARLLAPVRISMTQAPPQKPLIVIVGATGTGKSDVSALPTFFLTEYAH